jgi:hypothetical protein
MEQQYLNYGFPLRQRGRRESPIAGWQAQPQSELLR